MSYIELDSMNFADEVTKEKEMPVLVKTRTQTR